MPPVTCYFAGPSTTPLLMTFRAYDGDLGRNAQLAFRVADDKGGHFQISGYQQRPGYTEVLPWLQADGSNL